MRYSAMTAPSALGTPWSASPTLRTATGGSDMVTPDLPWRAAAERVGMHAMGLKAEVAVQTGAWALFSAGSVVGAVHTDGWFSAIFWLAAVVLAGIAGYGASLLYRSRG